MASSKKEDELRTLLISENFKKSCYAIISKFIGKREDVQEVYHKTRELLLVQNVEQVTDMRAFIAQAMINQAKAFFKKQSGSNEFPADGLADKSVTDTPFPHFEYEEIRKAVKKYRNEIDFAIFELNAQGYSDKEAADIIGMKYGLYRSKLCRMRAWIKKRFDGK